MTSCLLGAGGVLLADWVCQSRFVGLWEHRVGEAAPASSQSTCSNRRPHIFAPARRGLDASYLTAGPSPLVRRSARSYCLTIPALISSNDLGIAQGRYRGESS